MTKSEFLANKKAEQESKKVAIAATGINTNYDAQSKEYKEFRCKVNKWQKDTREYLAALGFDFTKCCTFVVEKGRFTYTEKGKVLLKKLPEEVINELDGEGRTRGNLCRDSYREVGRKPYSPGCEGAGRKPSLSLPL